VLVQEGRLFVGGEANVRALCHLSCPPVVGDGREAAGDATCSLSSDPGAAMRYA
jgi:hypothetical protein